MGAELADMSYMTWQWWLGLCIAIGVGMGCGSYATMPYYRLPKGEPCAGRWIGKRSHCTSCDHKLRTRDLFPVFNWLLTRGKCHFCGAAISPVYFFIELSVTVASVIIYCHHPLDQWYILLLGMAVCLIIITASDYSYRFVADPVLLALIMFGLLYRALLDGSLYPMVHSFTLAVLVAAALKQGYEHYTGKALTDYGYLKLLAVSGVWLNIPAFLLLLIYAGVLLLVVAAFRKSRLYDTSIAWILSLVWFIIVIYPYISVPWN